MDKKQKILAALELRKRVQNAAMLYRKKWIEALAKVKLSNSKKENE